MLCTPVSLCVPPAGVDALGALLALSLPGIAPPAMAAAAFAAILQQPELTASLSTAEAVDEDALEEQQGAGTRGSSGGDAAAALELVGVRPEVAAAVASRAAAGDAAFFSGWALLLAHLLAAPPDSHGRRLLAQALKEGHSLVPSLLDSLLPLLPLDGPSSRRDGAAAAAAAAAGPAADSNGFSSQLAALGPFPGEAYEPGTAAAQQQRRFAACLYAAALQGLPASARLWFADLRDRGTAAATERYTSSAVSGQLLAAELAAVAEVSLLPGRPCPPAGAPCIGPMTPQ